MKNFKQYLKENAEQDLVSPIVDGIKQVSKFRQNGSISKEQWHTQAKKLREHILELQGEVSDDLFKNVVKFFNSNFSPYTIE